MKKLALIEMFIGLLIWLGAFVVGKEAIAAIALMALTPLTSKKINPALFTSKSLFKAFNMFAAIATFSLLAINLIFTGNGFTEIRFPLYLGTIIFLHGIFLLTIRKN